MSSLSGKEILIIDDAADMRLLARKILEVDGATVTEADSIDIGVDRARQHVPHLILVDLEMPTRTGFDFLTLRETDAFFRGIPAIVLSGKKDRDSIQKAVALGATDYILKPFRATMLLQKIRKALRLSSFSSRKVIGDAEGDATFSVGGEIVKISDVACIVESPVKLGMQTDIRMKSAFFEELGLGELIMRSLDTPVKYVDGGQYSSEVNFVGIQRDQAAAIRKKIGGGR